MSMTSVFVGPGRAGLPEVGQPRVPVRACAAGVAIASPQPDGKILPSSFREINCASDSAAAAVILSVFERHGVHEAFDDVDELIFMEPAQDLDAVLAGLNVRVAESTDR